MKTLVVAVLWAVGAAVIVMTWWAWTLVALALFGLALLAWVPRLGGVVLDRIGWRRLPIVGKMSGFAASAAAFGLAVALLVAGTTFGPAPSTTVRSNSTDAATARPVTTTSGAQSSTACAPTPCASAGGLVLRVSNLNRNWTPPPQPTPSPRVAGTFPPPTLNPGFHFVRFEVSFEVVDGEPQIATSDVRLRDALGFEQSHFTSLGLRDSDCGRLFVRAAVGAKQGPIPLCFQAGGSPDGPLTVVWSAPAPRQSSPPIATRVKVEIPLGGR